MSIILDSHGNPIEREILREQQTSRATQLYTEFVLHPSEGLTPKKLMYILKEAEQGNLKAQTELFADMEERSPQVFAEMFKRKQSIMTLDHQIVPPPNASKEEKADTDYLNEAIGYLPNWDAMLFDMNDGIGHGFSNIEIQWDYIGREHVIQKFHYRPQSWFMVSKENRDHLLLRTDDNVGEPLQPFGWVQHRHRARSGYIARSGLYRTLVWPYLFSTFGIQALAQLLEIYGIPIRIGRYPAGIGKSEKNELLRAITQLGRSAGGIFPKEMEIEIVNAINSSHSPHMALNEWGEKAISKVISGGTLTMQADGKTSTNAQGNVHEIGRKEINRSDARQIEPTITRDICWPLLVLNRRGNADPRRMPKFEFDIKETASPSDLATLIPALVREGFPVPISWVQKKTNIPAPTDGEAILPGQSQVQQNQSAMLESLNRILLDGQNIAALNTTPTQSGIDSVLRSGVDVQGNQLSAILLPVLAKLNQTTDEGDMIGVLAEAFPNMDIAPLHSMLSDYMSIAKMIGLYSGQQKNDA